MVDDLKKAIEQQLTPLNFVHYELYCLETAATEIQIKERAVDSFLTSRSKGFSLRIIVDGRMGFSYSTDPSLSSVNVTVEKALVSARHSPPDDCYTFPEISLPLPEMGLCDSSTPPLNEKIERVKQLEDAALSFDKRITKVKKAAYFEVVETEHLVNSFGINYFHKGTHFSCVASVVAEGNGDSQIGWEFDFNRFYNGINFTKIGEAAARRALELLGARPYRSFRGPVVFENSVSCQLLEVLSTSFLAESVQKHKSFLKGKLHTQIFSPLINIIDDGLLPGGAATKPFDAEGVVRQNTPLVKQGVLIGLLYDTFWARKDRTISTGNSVRESIKSRPKSGHTNFYIQAGTDTMESFVAGIEHGLLINEVMGIHTANPISGDFSVGVNGFIIKGGKVVSPVKGVALAGNLFSLFNKVKGVGNDLRFWGSVGAPTLLVEDMDISGT